MRPNIVVFRAILVLLLALGFLSGTSAYGFLSACYGPYTSNFVVTIQEKLKKNGFDPGPNDGEWGPKTQDAAYRYQLARGIRNADMILGVLNGETLRSLFGKNFDPTIYGLERNRNLPDDVFGDYCE